MGPILYLVHKYSPYSIKASGLNSSWQCVWYVYGALLQQGTILLLYRKSLLFLARSRDVSFLLVLFTADFITPSVILLPINGVEFFCIYCIQILFDET